jgi:5-keto 4-deoxyuronate isomerase
MDDVEQFEDGCAVVGDCGGTVRYHFVHPARAQSCTDHFHDRRAGVYVAYNLRTPLRIVRSFTQKKNTRLLLYFRKLQACLTSFI